MRVILLVLLIAGAAPTMRAQTIAQREERVAALRTQLRETLATEDSLRRELDTIQIEGVRFVVRPEARAQAKEAAHLALAELDSILGPQDRHLLDGWVSNELRNGWVGKEGLQNTIRRVVRGAGDQRLQSLGGIALSQWSRWWNGNEGDLQAAFLDLVTSPAAGAKACFEGDTHACAMVLGLARVADRWSDLFDAAGRRIWVTNRLRWWRVARWPQARERTEEFRRCVDDEMDDACLDLLHAYSFTFPSLVSARCKRSVVLVAQSLGGDGAFTRLVADTTAALRDRLAAAAEVPLDSLLEVWRTRVLEARPPGTPVGPVAGWTSLLVVMIAGALAMRSTRWRLG